MGGGIVILVLEMRECMKNAINILIFLMVMLAWLSVFITREKSFTSGGLRALKYFTVESNLFCAIACLLCVIAGESHVVIVIRFVATVSVLVTMLIVILLLAPMQGFKKMFTGKDFIFHLVAPLTAVLSYLFLEENVAKGELFYGTIPVLLYGTGYLINILRHGAKGNDWYGFAALGEKQQLIPAKAAWWIEVILFGAFSFLLSWLLYALHAPA